MNQRRLFVASCLSIMATAMAFSIRADIIPAIKADYGFTDTQMGSMVGPGLWGFTITIVLGGFLVDWLGMKKLMILAFLGHICGTLLTVFATSFTSLFVATLIIGLANGTVEAVVNPLVASLYPESKTRHLNMLHAWWPGGLILGGLASYLITKTMGLDATNLAAGTLSLGWKLKMLLIIAPSLVYGYIILGETFPQTERVATGVSYGTMLKEAVRPMFLFFLVLMMMTAATELGPDQWVGNLLYNLVGIQGVLLLVYTAGIMFVLRYYFAGFLISKFSPLGVLTLSAMLSAIGLFWLSSSTSAVMVFAAATVFGFGKTFFWPTMIGVVAERFPKGGALLMCLLGGAGMFSAGFLMARGMGAVQDHYAVQQLSPQVQAMVVHEGGIDERKAEAITDPSVKSSIESAKQYSAVMTYRWVSVLPAILTVIFGLLYFYFLSQGGYKAIHIRDASPSLRPSPKTV